MGGKDARRCPRYHANFLLYHAGVDTLGYCYTRNISVGGCFVETGEPVSIGTEIEVEMFVDLGENALPLVARALVMWSNSDRREAKVGMGLSFTEMEEAARALLDRALEVVSSPAMPVPPLAT